jgi:hypothetical protein
MGRSSLRAGLGIAVALVATAPASAQTLPLTVPAARDAEAVVLTGADFGDWAAPANQTFRLPLIDLMCGGVGSFDPSQITEGGAGGITALADTSGCPHNQYSEPTIDTATLAPLEGTPTSRLLGYRWNSKAGKFQQIPFQVDEVFARYLNNSASGFSPYSGEDQHTTYAYDREGFRYRNDGPATDPCRAQPDSPVATDPVRGLDTNDEIAFMASDAGDRAPSGATLPKHVLTSREIRVTDPTNPEAPTRYVYVMKASEKGPSPAFGADTGYVRYQRDANADTFAFSESSYENYGNAPKGYYCDEAGNIVRNADGTPKIGQRRPRDTATISTSRYRFRYDGRWLMTKVEISPDGGKSYGPDLVDRWKARAFAQDPASETPCCGYEEEDTNWGGSSVLLGERSGPVRTIRETWGADSGTNVIRRETFYRDQMVQKNWLRVHVIPPLDGIYAQWDFNAGRIDTFRNARNPDGVPVDGRNDEAFGNLDDPCNPRYDGNDTSAFDQSYRTLYRELQFCEFPYHLSADPSDPTFTEANAELSWSAVSGAHGTIVDRISSKPTEMSLGGGVQALAAVPYYRDDSCFDDGTGSNPGPKLHLRSGDEPSTVTLADGTTVERKCWHPEDGLPADDPRFYQGSIATHGVHLLFIADSDNARMTVPTTEIVNDWQMVMLPGDQGETAGERYGRSFEKPLVAASGQRTDLLPDLLP